MGIWNRTTTLLAAAVLAAAAACVVVRHATVATAHPVALRMDDGQLAVASVDAQYRASARALGPGYDARVLAGSGVPGRRDGVGLYAQFEDPIDMSLSPDGSRLLVLDAGARLLREVRVATRQVSTLAPYDRLLAGTAREFARVIAVPDGALLVDGSRRVLVFVSRDSGVRSLTPAPGAPGTISDLAYRDGRLLVLDGPAGRVFEVSPGDWTWKVRATLGARTYDRLSADNTSVVVAASGGGPWERVGQGGESPAVNAAGGAADQIYFDPAGDRFVALREGRLSAVGRPAFASPPVPLTLFNIEGRPLGDPAAPFGYHVTWLDGATRIALDEGKNIIYALDRSGKRILQAMNSFVPWKYPRAGNSRGFFSPEYAPVKAAGTTRLLWVSHSVFWAPAGVEDWNLAVGAPRILEHVLNERWPLAGKWEVLNPGLTGAAFYTAAVPQTIRALRAYGVDRVIMLLDLQNFQWLFQVQGIGVPAAFDGNGIPQSIDAGLAGQPMLSRRDPPELAPLMQYIRARMVGGGSRTPLFRESGELLPDRFLAAWTEDDEFRTRLIDVFMRVVRGVKLAAATAGLQLTVLVAPTSNFVSIREWRDAYRMGGAMPVDFEAAHRPILEALERQGIPAYDLTYDMIARHPRLFPMNGNSHHRSHLFHRAVAESVQAVAERFGILPLNPQPERQPWNPSRAPVAEAGQAIVTARGGTCFVLHDLWQGRATAQGGPPSSFPALLSLAVADAAAAIDRAEYDCRTFEITFANVKNRDDYGNRDFRSIEEIGRLTVRSDQLSALAAAAKAGEDTPALRRQVNFR